MIHKISGCLISFCDVQPEERDVIEYGLEQGISAGLGMLITVLVGYALKIGPESLIFLMALIPLRMYAGGYHASTRGRCACISAVLMIIAFLIIKYSTLSSLTALILGGIEAGILYYLIPVDGNEKLEDIERPKYSHYGDIVVCYHNRQIWNCIYYSIFYCFVFVGIWDHKDTMAENMRN